jgi:hypothetical protein
MQRRNQKEHALVAGAHEVHVYTLLLAPSASSGPYIIAHDQPVTMAGLLISGRHLQVLPDPVTFPLPACISPNF